MTYILKKYFDDNHIPNIIFHDAFMTEIKKSIKYTADDDTFHDITSKYLPVISEFAKFWDENMGEEYGSPEFEISEITTLFLNSVHKPAKTLTREFMLDLLKNHATTEFTIEDDKYILHASCKLWDKRVDVETFFIYIISIIGIDRPTTMQHLYNKYKVWKHGLIMSKKCFETIAVEELNLSLLEHGVIDSSFWEKNEIIL